MDIHGETNMIYEDETPVDASSPAETAEAILSNTLNEQDNAAEKEQDKSVKSAEKDREDEEELEGADDVEVIDATPEKISNMGKAAAEETVEDGDVVTESDEDPDDVAPAESEFSMEQHMSALFNGEDLSEDFKDKASTIFETAVAERVDSLREKLEAEYNERLTTEIANLKEEFSAQLDSYLSYVVSEWTEDNRLAIENGVRTEIAEDFMEGLRNLFVEHNINIPEDKVDVLEEMTAKIHKLESRLNEQVNANIALNDMTAELQKTLVVDQISKGLADTQAAKLRQLAENLDANSPGEYAEKVEILKKNYFDKMVTEETDSHSEDDFLTEENNDLVNTNNTVSNNSVMQSYADTLTRISR